MERPEGGVSAATALPRIGYTPIPALRPLHFEPRQNRCLAALPCFGHVHLSLVLCQSKNLGRICHIASPAILTDSLVASHTFPNAVILHKF